MGRLFYDKSKEETVQSLTQKSTDILDVFTKTHQNLQEVNSKISTLAISKREQAKQILDEAESLEDMASKNDIIATKINSLIKS